MKAAQKVVVPTLLMRGALSDVVTMEDVEYFLSVIGHAKFVEIEKAAHMIAGDRNDGFAEEAIKFLRSLLFFKRKRIAFKVSCFNSMF